MSLFCYKKVKTLKAEVKKLEADIDVHINLVTQLEEKIQNMEDLELANKVLKMYIDDDEAVLELLEASKNKSRAESRISERQNALLGRYNTYAQMGRIGYNMGS